MGAGNIFPVLGVSLESLPSWLADAVLLQAFLRGPGSVSRHARAAGPSAPARRPKASFRSAADRAMGPTAWRYLKIRAELVEMMNGVRLNNHRIEELVDQLYGLNRRVIDFEGRLLRLAEKYKIPRESFVKQYLGRELDTNWLRRVKRLKDEGLGRIRQGIIGGDQGIPWRDFEGCRRGRPGCAGILPHRFHRPARRARGGAGKKGGKRRWSRPTCAW